MQPGDRIQKSASGRAALAGRSQDLTAQLRTLLLMIYGDKTAAEYSEIASRLPAGREGFQQLVAMGLVEVVPTLGEIAARAATTGGAATAPPASPAAQETLNEPQADVAKMAATHTVAEAELQRILYPEFVRAVADLGLRGVMLQMKVERAMSAQELLALRAPVEAALGKSKGDQARIDFSSRIDFLLSQ
jgi:hypothetical protein